MIYQTEESEKPSLTIFISVQLIGVERQVCFATQSNTNRLFSVGSFMDNEHYSYLQSFLIQVNPKENECQLQVHAMIPCIKSEKKKLLQKLSEFTTKIHQQKLGRGQVQLPLSFLLKKPYNMYNKQLQNQKLRIALQKLLQIINLQRDNSNKAQFDLRVVSLKTCMMMDKSTINALQIFSKDMEKKILSGNNTLYDIFNKCKTSFGTRCLKRWMKQPLQNKQELQSRLDKIQFFISHANIKNLIQNQLKKLPDLDRLYFVFYRVATGKKVKCQVLDLMKIYRVVQSLADLVKSLQSKDLSDSIILEVYQSIKRNVEIISRIRQMIQKGIDMSGPRDSQFFVRPETQASLDAINKERKSIQASINHQVSKVSRHLGLEVEKIPSNTHKYVLQASKKNSINKIKETPGYKFLTAKQTKITFITDQLTKLCQRLRIVEQTYQIQQQTILKKIFQLVAGYYPVMQQLSFILSELDVLTTIASIVITSNGIWCRPRFSDSLIGKAMRHPCIKNCIPNDCQMSNNKTIVLTGPNMGGKSTYIRTIGVCTYLAHIGCYVPAFEFESPIVDAIITRVGASDLQVRGISTFMSQMLESSCMLETATKNSLVLIDELGRGTSTTEGFGIAWAICESLHKEINPFCLFATHFHQMTRMAEEVKGVKNMYTTCRVQGGELLLEYKVEQGKMKKSYGIEVMKLLKFPKDVISVAESYLEYYQDKTNDSIVSNLSNELKDKINQLVDQLQQKLSKISVSEQEQVRKSYQQKIREVLGVNN